MSKVWRQSGATTQGASLEQRRAPRYASALLCAALLLLPLLATPARPQFEDLPEQLAVEFGEVPAVGGNAPAIPGRGGDRGRNRFGGSATGMGLFESQDNDDVFGGLPLGADEYTRRTSSTSKSLIPSSYDYAGYGYGSDGGYGLSGSGTGARGTYRRGGRNQYVLGEKIKWSGSASYAARYNHVTGDAEQFTNQFTDINATEPNASLFWAGKLFGPIYSTGNVRLGPYTPTVADWSVSYLQKHYGATYGDLTVDMGRSPFVRLQQSIAGFELNGEFGDSRATFFTAGQKGRVRTDTIAGEGTSGPYRLQYAPIRDGSESVRVDGQTYTQAQYNLDYDTGLLTFEDGIVIATTSVIVVKYEENNSSSTQGQYYGLDVSTRIGKIPLGLVYLSQEAASSRTSGTTSLQQTETFFGNNTIGPFILSRRPIDFTKPIEVYVDGIARYQSQDWEINATSGAIIFYTIVSATATVIVKYYYINEDQEASTGLKLLGFDTGVPFTNGAIALSYGHSRSSSASGNAFKARGTYDLLDGRVHVDAGYIYMTPTFQRLGTTSFDRDRQGLDLSIDAEPIDDLRVWFDTTRDRSDTSYSTGASSGGIGSSTSTTDVTNRVFNVTTSRWSGGFDLSRRSWPDIQFNMSRINIARPTWGQSYVGTESGSVSHRFGKRLSVGAAFDQTARQFTPVTASSSSDTSSTTTTTEPEDTLTRQVRLQGKWDFRDTDSVSINYATQSSKDRIDSDLDSSGHSLDARVSIAPTKKLNIMGGYRKTYSRGAVYTGSYSSYSSGYGDYGGYSSLAGTESVLANSGREGPLSAAAESRAAFRTGVLSSRRLPLLLMRASNRAAGDGDYSNALTDDSGVDLAVDFTPSDKVSVNYSLSQRRYCTEGDVGYISDNDTLTHTVGFMVRPFSRLSIGGSYTKSSTDYLDHAVGTVLTDGFDLSGELQISKRISAHVGYYLTNAVNPTYTGSNSGSGGDTGVTLVTGSSFSTISAGLDLRLTNKTSLRGRYELSRNRGAYDDSDRAVYRLSIEQGLTDDLGLTVELRHINYAGRASLFGLSQDRAYKATTLQAQLSARFN